MKSIVVALIILVGFSSFTVAQEETKMEKVNRQIDEIIAEIDGSIDTIYVIDKIDNLIYDEHAHLKNLIEYYSDMGGDKQKVKDYMATYDDLAFRLDDRKVRLNNGNFVNLPLKEKVETKLIILNQEIEEIETKRDFQNVERGYELIRISFDVWMEENTVMPEWKADATRRLDDFEARLKKIGEEFD